jgi:streptomycin 6-kinase
VTPVDPSGCAQKIIDVHGQAGVEWLARLPELVAEVAARWSLTVLPPFPELSYNYVAPAVGPDGAALVLKAGVPHRELWDEIEALRLYDGRGIARLVAADRERGVLLLERVRPGGSLRSVADSDDQARVVAEVLRALDGVALPDGHPFRTIADLARGFERLRKTFGGYGPFPAERVARAEGLFHELARETAARLIHGDLNPGNILRATRAPWLAIDPKGYAGDPLWDVATFLNDPPSDLSPGDLRRLQARRVAGLAEALGVARSDILAWAEAHAVLSAWWSYEDHGRGWETGVYLAVLYAELA